MLFGSFAAFVGAGPYIRVRPIPGEFGRRFFLHTAGYGAFIINPEGDTDFGVLPNAFIGYEFKKEEEKDYTRFFGFGLEGLLIIGQRF